MNARARDERITSLTINNLYVADVGTILELLYEHGFDVEINLGAPMTEEERQARARYLDLDAADMDD